MSVDIRKSARFFVNQGKNTYSERLLELTTRMITESEMPKYDLCDVKSGRRYRFRQLIHNDLLGIIKTVYRRVRYPIPSLRRRLLQ